MANNGEDDKVLSFGEGWCQLVVLSCEQVHLFRVFFTTLSGNGRRWQRFLDSGVWGFFLLAG